MNHPYWGEQCAWKIAHDSTFAESNIRPKFDRTIILLRTRIMS